MISTRTLTTENIAQASTFESVHLVGICGTGMKALAELLAGLGCRVSGSDQLEHGPLQQAMAARGLRIHSGHHDRFVPTDVDVVVRSPAVELTNREVAAAIRQGIPVLTYSQMLGQLMQGRCGVSIAGTHGKSTTTAMVAHSLQYSDRNPSAVFGAELGGTDVSGWSGESDLFVVESCEYQRNFLDLKPQHAAILGIEADHFDCFSSIDDNVRAFTDFAASLPGDGSLLLNADCPHAAQVADSTSAAVSTFSLNAGSSWWASDLRKTPSGTRFRVFHHGNYFCEILLPLIGRHNVANSLAAIAMLQRLGLTAQEIQASLAEFPGIRRRYERIGSWRGITLIDDYAHHPTAIKATLQAARQEFGSRRIWCAFQPHQISRTKSLMDDFAGAFGDADRVLISPVFAAREDADLATATEVSSELAENVCRNGQQARSVDSLDRIIATLDDETVPGDVLVTMGAGNINRVHHEFTRRLQRNP